MRKCFVSFFNLNFLFCSQGHDRVETIICRNFFENRLLISGCYIGLPGQGLGVRAPPEFPRGQGELELQGKNSTILLLFIVNKKPDVTYNLNITK